MIELTVFYDAGCPLCASEIDHLRRLDSDHNMAFEDIFAPQFTERFPHIDPQKANRLLHGELANGDLIYGLDVTYLSWCLVGRRHWVAMLRWPVFKPIINLAYGFFAKHRQRISALLTGQARCERCALNNNKKRENRNKRCQGS